MPHPLSVYRAFNERFDPLGRLDPQHVTAWYAERSPSPWEDVTYAISTSSQPTQLRMLVAGPRGTGKTTELMRVFADLASDGEHAPVYVDIASALPDDVGTLPILAMIIAAVERTADDWNAPKRTTGSLGDALQQFEIPKETIDSLSGFITAASVAILPDAVPQVAAAAASLSVINQLRTLGKTVLNRPVTEQAPESVKALTSAAETQLQRLQDATGRNVVILLDGLDKRSSVAAMEAALHDADVLASLPCTLVLSGPMHLSLDARFASGQLPGRFQPVPVPNIPVIERTASGVRRCDAGIGMFRDLFGRRTTDDDGRTFRGMFPEAVRDQAAEWSSGVVREFLTLLTLSARSLSRRDGDVVSLDDLEDAARERRHLLQRSLDAEQLAVLARVLRTGQPASGEAWHDLVLTNVVACYPNGDVWFRPNELLVDYIRAAMPPDEA